MRQHVNSLNLVLTREQEKKKRRKNVIDMAGHGITFGLELLFVILQFVPVPAPLKTTLVDFLWRCVLMSPYGIYAMVNLAFSASLREEMYLLLENDHVFKFVRILNFLGIGSFYKKLLLHRR